MHTFSHEGYTIADYDVGEIARWVSPVFHLTVVYLCIFVLVCERIIGFCRICPLVGPELSTEHPYTDGTSKDITGCIGLLGIHHCCP